MRSFCSYMIPYGFFYHKTDKMGCVPSNSSGHPQPNTQVINPTHHFDAPSNTMENRASHLTLYGYGELVQKSAGNNDATLPIQDTAGKKDSHDETGVKRNRTEDMGSMDLQKTASLKPGIKRNRTEDIENKDLQKVASLKQWLQTPGGGGAAAVIAAAAADTSPKFGFSFYDNNKVTNHIDIPE
ncbi:hypothetical protein HanRHA438_Chr13g0606401 [Helianthus annuus]|nr:hypothetical protein HanIR_Chr13g0648071 [Helianthus annuus]KAJ0858898.1 hypothetical protein HanRHA438_Chr13g0606401 [Helianthus annuus]